MFQLTKNVSSSQLKTADTSLATSLLQCAGQCLNKQEQEGTCTAFQLEEQDCKLLHLTERKEKTVSDDDWPDDGVYVSQEAVTDTPLYCNGGIAGFLNCLVLY